LKAGNENLYFKKIVFLILIGNNQKKYFFYSN